LNEKNTPLPARFRSLMFFGEEIETLFVKTRKNSLGYKADKKWYLFFTKMELDGKFVSGRIFNH